MPGPTKVSIVLLVVGFALIICAGWWYTANHIETTPGQTPPELNSTQNPPMANLQMTDAVVGTGTEAKNGDAVTVNYRGTLDDGKQFDSSYGHEPFSFTLGAGQVIKGWDLGVLGMKVGGKRELVIPADLGYGVSGYPPIIPGNATLHFTVELLSVNNQK